MFARIAAWMASAAGVLDEAEEQIVHLEKENYALRARLEEKSTQLAELKAERKDHIEDLRATGDWVARLTGRIPIYDKEAAAKQMEAIAASNKANAAVDSKKHPGAYQPKRRTSLEELNQFYNKYDIHPANLHQHMRREAQPSGSKSTADTATATTDNDAGRSAAKPQQ